MIIALVIFKGLKEKDTHIRDIDFDIHDTFWYKWRIYYLLPVPFMVLAIIIFIIFANKETIEYYVKQGSDKKEEAILLM